MSALQAITESKGLRVRGAPSVFFRGVGRGPRGPASFPRCKCADDIVRFLCRRRAVQRDLDGGSVPGNSEVIRIIMLAEQATTSLLYAVDSLCRVPRMRTAPAALLVAWHVWPVPSPDQRGSLPPDQVPDCAAPPRGSGASLRAPFDVSPSGSGPRCPTRPQWRGADGKGELRKLRVAGRIHESLRLADTDWTGELELRLGIKSEPV